MGGCSKFKDEIAEHVDSDVNIILIPENVDIFENSTASASEPSFFEDVSTDASQWSEPQRLAALQSLDRAQYALGGELGFMLRFAGDIFLTQGAGDSVVETDFITLDQYGVLSYRGTVSDASEGLYVSVVLQVANGEHWSAYAVSNDRYAADSFGIANVGMHEMLNSCDYVLDGKEVRFAYVVWDAGHSEKGMYYVHVSQSLQVDLGFTKRNCGDGNPVSTIMVELDEASQSDSVSVSAITSEAGSLCAKMTYGDINRDGVDPYVIVQDLGNIDANTASMRSFLLQPQSVALEKIDLVLVDGQCSTGHRVIENVVTYDAQYPGIIN